MHQRHLGGRPGRPCERTEQRTRGPKQHLFLAARTHRSRMTCVGVATQAGAGVDRRDEGRQEVAVGETVIVLAQPGQRSTRRVARAERRLQEFLASQCRHCGTCTVTGDVDEHHADQFGPEQCHVVAVASHDSLGRLQFRGDAPPLGEVADLAAQTRTHLRGECRSLLEGRTGALGVVALREDRDPQQVDRAGDVTQFLRTTIGHARQGHRVGHCVPERPHGRHQPSTYGE